MRNTYHVSAVLAGLLLTCSWAAEPVQFADPDLKEAVKVTLGIDHDPTSEEMLGLTQLVARKLNIQSLRGLEYARNLTLLDTGVNQITDISPLAGLTGLTNLTLSRNQIADISALAEMTGLMQLDLSGNPITDISVLSVFTGLSYLGLANVLIDDISVLEGLTQLVVLDLDGAAVADFSPVAGMTDLEELYLADTQISDTSILEGKTRLRRLNLRNCHLSDSQLAVLADMPDMSHLWLQGNNIQDISFLSGMANLKQLYLEGNQISDISPLAGTTNLTKLTLPDNSIADISPLGDMMYLTLLDLQGNPLDAEAYSVHIAQIKQNNPQADVLYDVPIWVRTLTVLSTEGGTVTIPGTGRFHFVEDTTIPIEASPASEIRQFAGWTGSAVNLGKVADPLALQTTLIVDANCWIQANFTEVNDPWQVVYFNDFEEQVGPEWSAGITDITPVGDRRFLGQFGNDMVTLTLADLPPHSNVRLSFDLFVLRSWDGDAGPVPEEFVQGDGPDIWSVTVENDPPLLRTTFDNRGLHPGASCYRQSYPGDYPSEGFFSQTGASEINTLGYSYGYHRDVGELPSDAVYHLSFSVRHMDSVLGVCFAASGLSGLDDESWGLDNVQVDLPQASPEPLVVFGDTQLQACVEGQLGLTALRPSDMRQLTELICKDRSISDLTGLEYALNLTILKLQDNAITDISPLRDLRQLAVLYLQDNSLNSDAYSIYLPELRANNPDAAIQYDPPLIAWSPDPANGAVDVTPQTLRWTAGETAVAHDVYFGASAPLGEQDLLGRYTATECPCPAGLDPATTYYWRVDEVEEDDVTVHTGDTWSFTTSGAGQ
jgi:Leucine-rich repeat (LRR) protein